MAKTKAKLWMCPKCGRGFANRNQTHFCSDVGLESHFEGKPPKSRELFDAFLAAVKACGLVKVLPEKTRIAFQVRMSFAAVMVRRGYLRGHLVLAERHERPCFYKVETFSPRNHLHAFELREVGQLEGEMKKLIAAAYRVGCQEHIKPTRPKRVGAAARSR